MAKHITGSEYDAVIATAYCYVEAMEKGSSKRAKEGFHPGGGIYGYVDGEFKGDQSPEGHKIKAHLDVIAMTPTTAIVKTEVEMNPPETDYTDFLGMVKIDGKWQIVSKIFHSYPR
ncbi:hypothetical protein PT974_08889 [Cladobotryum mycophilum]|uniref:Lumazine-binding protein n=1 Tax=Cladobotryum mycophilum TaxID=491253 RepID=A0ABR0SFT4_9HYPO